VCDFVCAFVCVRTCMWRTPLTGAPGHPGYLAHEHHNLIIPHKAVTNASKNCKGDISLSGAIQTSSKHVAGCRNVGTDRNRALFAYVTRACVCVCVCLVISHCSPPLATAIHVSLPPCTGRGASLCTLFKTAVLPADVRA
jgi:hypothetical protein